MAYIWGETFSNIRYSGLIGVLSVIVVILTTMVLTTLLMIANYIHSELNVLKQSPLVMVFLQDGLKDSARQRIQKELKSLPQVQSSHYVSKQDALRKTREMFADRKEILEGLEDSNPLPSSFEVKLKPQFLDNAKEVVARLNGLPGVEDVQYAERTSELVRKVETALIFLGSMLGLASIVIICFSIMLTTYIRREEIRIMRLVGATTLFIRAPLLLQGVMQGLIGSAMGLAILYGVFRLLAVKIGPVSFLPEGHIVLVIGVGALMGFIGGAIPLRRLVKV